MLSPPTNYKTLVLLNTFISEENMCSHHTFYFSRDGIVEYLYISIPYRPLNLFFRMLKNE